MCISGGNGSGKSTFLRIIAGLSSPTSGTIKIKLNQEIRKPSPRIGFCPDNPEIYRNVSVSDFLNFISCIIPLEIRESQLIEFVRIFDLIKWLNVPIGTLSKGMLHKVALIASMIDSPQLLILDEPFSSLDEKSADVLIKKLRSLASMGSSIIFADPSRDRSEKMADKTFNLDKSKVMS